MKLIDTIQKIGFSQAIYFQSLKYVIHVAMLFLPKKLTKQSI